jgi:hypothetical protein
VKESCEAWRGESYCTAPISEVGVDTCEDDYCCRERSPGLSCHYPPDLLIEVFSGTQSEMP